MVKITKTLIYIHFFKKCIHFFLIHQIYLFQLQMLKVVQSGVCFNNLQIFTFHDLRKLYTLVTIFILFYFFALLYIVYSGGFFFMVSKKKKKKPKKLHVSCRWIFCLFLFPFFISRTISVRLSHLIDKNKNDPFATF